MLCFLKVLEENCIQDLMYCAVHAQRTGTQSMASRLRKVDFVPIIIFSSIAFPS